MHNSGSQMSTDALSMEPPKEVQQAPTLASVSEEGKEEDGVDDGANPMPKALPSDEDLTISPEHMMLKHPLQV